MIKKTKNNIIYIMKILFIISIITVIQNIKAETFALSAEQPLSDGVYIIKSALNEELVLDINASSKENGGNLQLWKNAATSNQMFSIKYIGNGCYSMNATHTDKYIDVEASSQLKGTNVFQWSHHNGDNQKWIIKDAGNGYFNIISKINGLYLDVPESKGVNGANIQVWSSNGANNQKFKFELQGDNNNIDTPLGTKTIEDGTYQIKTASNLNNVLDIAQSSLQDGGNIGVWSNGFTANQKFNIKFLGDGYYSIEATHSGKYMDLSESSKKNGANVDQWKYHGGDNQKWVIRDAGDGYYYIISKSNGLYLTQYSGNIETRLPEYSNNQKFKIEKPSNLKGDKTIENGTYIIASAFNNNYVLDVPASSKNNGELITIWRKGYTSNQKFEVKYIGDGYYTIKAQHSEKALQVANGSTIIGTKISQYDYNESNSQKWIIKDAGDGYYYIISRNSELYLNIDTSGAIDGANLSIQNLNGTQAQKFKFTSPERTIDLDETKYPGYKEALQNLQDKHPTWNFQFLYTGLKFDDAVAGEYSVRARNLVPTTYGGEWISGTTLYDTGWYAASEKAIAYYMDPRNFLDETNIFQFEDVNMYTQACTLDGIKSQVANSFLANYAQDIENACRDTNVNPYYIIARLFQENGRNPTRGTYKMDGGDGKYYYNPFNIGATGNSTSEVLANALARAKREGWDTMEKALEGGIYFCKENWLENYQNTLYQNRFDIDSTNGTALYSHQYMQNLMGAYSEARTLCNMYKNTGKIESEFTFIIPLYEGMDSTLSPMPSNNAESSIINVRTTGTKINIRSGANTDSTILREIGEKGTILLSIQRGVNSNWQKIVTSDGLIGYVSGSYLEQIDDVKTCNYTAKVKTNDGNGCNIRIAPNTNSEYKISALSDGTSVTVIDDSTYKNINGYNWSRIILSNGTQAFMPSNYLAR